MSLDSPADPKNSPPGPRPGVPLPHSPERSLTYEAVVTSGTVRGDSWFGGVQSLVETATVSLEGYTTTDEKVTVTVSLGDTPDEVEALQPEYGGSAGRARTIVDVARDKLATTRLPDVPATFVPAGDAAVAISSDHVSDGTGWGHDRNNEASLAGDQITIGTATVTPARVISVATPGSHHRRTYLTTSVDHARTALVQDLHHTPDQVRVTYNKLPYADTPVDHHQDPSETPVEFTPQATHAE
ncbi:hypothetical protein RYH80_17875 [Halobaculum sp. MBLA0147]|uniref:hypothetical protein n=1 Tax=Halobaculum sp. MBLA0147 TaxID=3079934 RepID=UPI003524881D